MFLGEGFGVGFRWVVGCGLTVENEGKGDRGGEGGGGEPKELASQCAGVCQNYPLAKYLFSFSLIAEISDLESCVHVYSGTRIGDVSPRDFHSGNAISFAFPQNKRAKQEEGET